MVILVLINIPLYVKQLSISKNVLVLLLLFFLPLTNIHIYQRRTYAVTQNNPWYYQPKTMQPVYSFFSHQKNAKILASYEVSNNIPPFSVQRVYSGHTIQTPDFYTKTEKAIRFYSGEMNEKEAELFLHSNNIQYVVYGPYEKELGRLVHYPFLHPALKNKDVIVYRVR